MQSEDVRDTPCRKAVAHPTNTIHARWSRDLGKLSGRDANKDSHSAAHELLPTGASSVSRCVAVLEQEALLWIHGACFGEGEGEATIVKELQVEDEGSIATSLRNFVVGRHSIPT